MKRSLNDGSGFLSIDHKDSPGLRPDEVPAGFITSGAGEVLERDVKQCSHCERTVVLNPGRVRERAVCHKCYHYICDQCESMRAATGDCVPYKQVLDRLATITEKYINQPDHPAADVGLSDLTVPSEPKIFLTDIPDK